MTPCAEERSALFGARRSPWLDDGDVQFYHGDACEVLRSLPAGSAQTCVTSPPYWGLRDYGTGSWTGGDADCDHKQDIGARASSGLNGSLAHKSGEVFVPYGDVCGRCGARRVDAQLGLEATPAAYVAALVAVFAEVWRVLRADGTLWLNLGDSYAHSMRQSGAAHAGAKQNTSAGSIRAGFQPLPAGMKEKDLVGVPWRVAFALQEAGWYLRSDIVWSKPNPMPESVTDRPTKAHEYVFLLAKQPRYYYDADAIREASSPNTTARPETSRLVRGTRAGAHFRAGESETSTKGNVNGNLGLNRPEAGRNARSVWEIATQPTPEAHFATFPEALVRRCILAGTSEHGECSVCGAPWQRVVDEQPDPRADFSPRSSDSGWAVGAGRADLVGSRVVRNASGAGALPQKQRVQMGWAASCACGAPAVPQTVLDPFVGSGTTALVARKHGRRATGIDLSADYLAIAARRLGQQSLFATSEGAA